MEQLVFLVVSGECIICMKHNFSVSDKPLMGIGNDSSRGMQCIVSEWE